MRNLDAIIRVSNYVSLNPGPQRARSLWSGASDNLIMHVFPLKENLCNPRKAARRRKAAVLLARLVRGQSRQNNDSKISPCLLLSLFCRESFIFCRLEPPLLAFSTLCCIEDP